MSPPEGAGAAQEGYRELEQELATLHRVAAAVATEQDQRAVFALVAEGAARSLGAEAGLVARFDGAGATPVGVWGASAHGTAATFGTTLPLDADSALALVRHDGQARRVEVRSGAAGGFLSRAAAPVRPGGGLWGAVEVSTRDRALPARAEECLIRLAELTALAVTSAAGRAKLVAWASTDHLTGLPNRRAFDEHLAEEVALAHRHGRPLGLVILDLDHFKRVNDDHGHLEGDRVLAEAGRRLAAQVRGEEMISRVGGEEFAWLLPGSDGPGACAAAERGRRAIGGAPFPGVGHLTISAGACDLGQLGRVGGAGELYRLADVALYWAKAAGRDVCVPYSGDDRITEARSSAPRPRVAAFTPPGTF